MAWYLLVKRSEARTVAQQLRALVAIAEDQGWILNTYMICYNHLCLQF